MKKEVLLTILGVAVWFTFLLWFANNDLAYYFYSDYGHEVLYK